MLVTKICSDWILDVKFIVVVACTNYSHTFEGPSLTGDIADCLYAPRVLCAVHDTEQSSTDGRLTFFVNYFKIRISCFDTV